MRLLTLRVRICLCVCECECALTPRIYIRSTNMYNPSHRYCYVKSKEDLGSAISTKRPTSCVLISKKPIMKKAAKTVKADADDDDDKYGKDFDKMKKKIEAIQMDM